MTTKNVEKNAVPLIGYYDIFKNYYANTQEEKFYTIGGALPPTLNISGAKVPNIKDINVTIKNGEILTFGNVTELSQIRMVGSENSR